MSLSCTVSEILSHISQNVKTSRDPENMPFIIRALVHLCINQHTTFGVPSFTDSEDKIWAKFKKTGHVTHATLTTPISA